MAKAFSVLSWNVEHFGATDKRKKKFIKDPKPIIEKIAEQNADIVTIFEVRSDIVFRPLLQEMSNYHFFISEGPQMQEILVGVRKSIATFTTQKTEFKAAQRRGMSLLGKTQANTYWHPKYGESDLDQVVAMEHLEFRSFGGKPVRVTGWPDEPTDDDKAAWVETFSDHALLYFEVQKV